MSLYALISGETIEVDASGGTTIGTCQVQAPKCTAKQSTDPGVIMIAFQGPNGEQINTCSTCMEWMIANKRWRSKHTPKAASM